MRSLLPRTMAGRSVLALLVGLTLSHGFSVVTYRLDRQTTLEMLTGHQIAEQVLSISQLFASIDATSRERLLIAVNGPTMRVAASDNPDAQARPNDSQAESIRAALIRGTAGGGATEILVSKETGTRHLAGAKIVSAPENRRDLRADSFIDGLRISIRLPDQNWLNFNAPFPRVNTIFSGAFLLSTSIMAGAILIFSIWIVRLATRPLNAFANAAERLGVDIGAAPLAVDGPDEVAKASRAFNKMQARLQRMVQDRMEMLAAISHDLRTPITRLRLRAEFLNDPDQRLRMLNDLDQMEKMISATLSFCREEAVEELPRLVNLSSLVQSVCDDAVDSGRNVEFVESGKVQMSCRPLAVRRAVTNLVDNAVKYGAVARVRIVPSKATIEMQVDDDGPGIPEKERERVFAPFYRIEHSRNSESGGTGLGLSVARAVARSHGGDVWLENRPEGGLRARLTLPR